MRIKKIQDKIVMKKYQEKMEYLKEAVKIKQKVGKIVRTGVIKNLTKVNFQFQEIITIAETLKQIQMASLRKLLFGAMLLIKKQLRKAQTGSIAILLRNLKVNLQANVTKNSLEKKAEDMVAAKTKLYPVKNAKHGLKLRINMAFWVSITSAEMLVAMKKQYGAIQMVVNLCHLLIKETE